MTFQEPVADGFDHSEAPADGGGPLAAFGKNVGTSVVLVGGLLAFMWLIEALDTFALGDRLQSNGILPRSLAGLDGVLWSPFLHSGFPHLISNSIPFGVLSLLILTGGRSRYIKASAIIIVLGGLLVWAFAIGSNENHIGASGWVFGMLGFLLAAAVLEKRPLSIVAGFIAIIFYGGTILVSFVPTAGISWEGHLFGFVAGMVTARLTVQKRSLPSLEPPALG